MHEGQSHGLAPGTFFFGHQMPVTASRVEKNEGPVDDDEEEEERRTKTRGKDGWRRRRGTPPPLLKSCHVALIHPASLERGKGPEGLSQDRGPGSHSHTQMRTCTLGLSPAHASTQIRFLFPAHEHRRHRRMALRGGSLGNRKLPSQEGTGQLRT